jgi:hypothetical protein
MIEKSGNWIIGDREHSYQTELGRGIVEQKRSAGQATLRPREKASTRKEREDRTLNSTKTKA